MNAYIMVMGYKKHIIGLLGITTIVFALNSCSNSDNRDRTASDAGSSDTDDPNTDILDESTPKAAGHGADDRRMQTDFFSI